MEMSEHQESITHARMCVSAISLWLTILADYCDRDEIAALEMHLSEIRLGLDLLIPTSSQHPN
jgi:hypothetical protein